MPKQLGKGLSFGYAVGIPRHRKSLRSLVLVWGLNFSFSGMDMAQISGAFWKGGNCTELKRMLAPHVNNSQLSSLGAEKKLAAEARSTFISTQRLSSYESSAAAAYLAAAAAW
jgi:hypothetical protein